MIRRPPRSTRPPSSAASDVYKRQFTIYLRFVSKLYMSRSKPDGNIIDKKGGGSREPQPFPADRVCQERILFSTSLLLIPIAKKPSPIPGGGFFIGIRIPPAVPVVPKSFSFAQSRRSGKPPLCKGRWAKSLILLGGVVLVVTIPQSAVRLTAPFIQGSLGCVCNRVCGGRAGHAGERYSMSL